MYLQAAVKVAMVLTVRGDSMRTVRGAQSGQAMIEYLISAAVLLAAVAILAIFLYVFKQNGGRILDLIAYEYP